MKKLPLIGFLLLVLPVSAQHSVIFPEPNTIQQSPFVFPVSTLVYVPSFETDTAIAVVAPQFKRYGIRLEPVQKNETPNIVFSKNESLAPELYTLTVEQPQIRI